MVRLKRIEFKKVKEFSGKLIRVLAVRAFLTILAFIFLALIVGGLVFYKYSFLLKEREPELREKPLYFDQTAFQQVLNIWKIRQQKFQETELKDYPDLFRASAPASEELTE